MSDIVRIALPLLLLSLLPCHGMAQDAPCRSGMVVDAATGRGIPSATIASNGGEMRAYSDSSGAFILQLPSERTALSVTALGYADPGHTDVVFLPGTGAIRIALSPDSVRAEPPLPDAGEIVRRAIARKKEMLGRLRSLRGRRYTKLDASMLGPIVLRKQGDDIAVAKVVATHATPRQQRYLLETIADVARSLECDQTHTEIRHRRATEETIPASEILALGAPIDLYDDDVRIASTIIPSPLGDNAEETYSFTTAGRTRLAGNDVAVIAVEPRSGRSPAFRGRLMILSETFEPVEAELSLAPGSAVPFVGELHLRQRFEPIAPGIRYPTYLQVTAHATVRIVRAVAETKVALLATTIHTDLRANVTLPADFCDEAQENAIHPEAGSTRPEFWERHAPLPLSASELAAYHASDSMAANIDSATRAIQRNPLVNGTLLPLIDFNRVAGEVGGISFQAPIGIARLKSFGSYSLNLERFFGSVELRLRLIEEDAAMLGITGRAFSVLGTTSSDRTYPMLANALSTWLFHSDYYDYYLDNGWGAGVEGEIGGFRGNLEIGRSRQQSIENTTARFYFGKEPYRPNPAIDDGEFTTVRAALRWGTMEEREPIALSVANATLRLPAAPPLGVAVGVTALGGDGDRRFGVIEAFAVAALPTVATGYLPMTLRMRVEGGIGTHDLPVQHQLRMRVTTGLLGELGHFYSAPIGQFGGTSYIAIHADHNFSDVLWRRFGLPTFEGRGMDVAITGSTGLFRQSAQRGYRSTDGAWYTEIGLRLGRIPIAASISNVLFLQLDARWGVGRPGNGRFGLALGISSPF